MWCLLYRHDGTKLFRSAGLPAGWPANSCPPLSVQRSAVEATLVMGVYSLLLRGQWKLEREERGK